MSERTLKLYLSDIKNAITKIENYCQNLTFGKFSRDAKTIDAVVRNMEIIGEAAKHIPQEFRIKHMDVPWKEIIGSRSKLIHEYFGIDVEIVWKTVTDDIPELKKQIEGININS